jgi:hypothetical protein
MPSTISYASTRLWDGLAIAVLAITTIVAVLTFRDFGLGWDDYTHAQYGDLLLSLYTICSRRSQQKYSRLHCLKRVGWSAP